MIYKIEIAGYEKVYRVLFEMEKKVLNLRPLWRKIIQILPERIRRNFETIGSRLGAIWAPLDPEYAKRKAKLYPGRPILIASGRMFEAGTRLNAPGNYIYWTRSGQGSADTMIYGIDWTKFRSGYPRYHQTGTSKMPKRLFFGLSREDAETLSRLIINYFKIGKSGLDIEEY